MPVRRHRKARPVSSAGSKMMKGLSPHEIGAALAEFVRSVRVDRYDTRSDAYESPCHRIGRRKNSQPSTPATLAHLK
jgi:hypothetical protein